MIRLVIVACIVVLTCGGVSPKATASDDLEIAPVAEKTDERSPLPESDEGSHAEADANPEAAREFERHRAGACPEGPPCQVED